MLFIINRILLSQCYVAMLLCNVYDIDKVEFLYHLLLKSDEKRLKSLSIIIRLNKQIWEKCMKSKHKIQYSLAVSLILIQTLPRLKTEVYLIYSCYLGSGGSRWAASMPGTWTWTWDHGGVCSCASQVAVCSHLHHSQTLKGNLTNLRQPRSNQQKLVRPDN